MSLNYLWLLLALIFPMALSAQTTQICNETPANSPTHVHPDCYEGVRIEAAGDPNCFDGKATIKSGDNIDFFATESVTLNAGFSTEVGAQFHAEVVNSLEEGCAISGNESFCGFFIKPNQATPQGIDFIDRFGNYYTSEELVVKGPNVDSKYFNNCGCEDIGIDTKYFNIFFEDCIFNTDIGFSDPNMGEARRRVLCQTFAEISNTIIAVDESKKVNVQIQPSGRVEDYNDDVLPRLSEGVLGIGGPYSLLADRRGIIDGAPWSIINSGQITDFYRDNYHGILRFNFAPEYNYNWYLGEVDPAGDMSLGFDFKTVILHEVTHLLGFLSFLEGNGGSIVKGTTDGIGGYSRLDKSLSLEPASINVINNEPIGGIEWKFDQNSIDTPTEMYSSCRDSEGITGPDIVFNGVGTPSTFPIFTGTLGNASAFSHLAKDCDGTDTEEYVMHPGLEEGVRRNWTTGELNILCKLGYTINNNGATCGCSSAGVNDNTDRFGTKWEVPFCDVLFIKKEDLLWNDHNVEDVLYTQLEPVFSSYGSVTSVEDDYYFTPNGIGQVFLRYVPTLCSGEIGNITYVTIDVILGEDCAGSCTKDIACTEDLTCSFCIASTNCDRLRNEFNLICDPHFCGTHVDNNTTIDMIAIISKPPRYVCPGAILPNWIPTRSIASYNPLESRSAGNGSIHINTGNENYTGIFTLLPLQSQTTYLLSFFKKDAEIGIGHSNTFLVDIVEGEGINNGNPENYDGLPPLIIIEQEIGDLFDFTRIGGTISVTDNEYDALRIHSLPNNGVEKRTFIDDVELIEDNFTAGEDEFVQYCGLTARLGMPFHMLSDIEIEYTWRKDGNIIGQYNVKNETIQVLQGNIDPETHELMVSPQVTSTYELSRRIVDYAGMDPTQFSLPTSSDLVTVRVGLEGVEADFMVDQTECSFRVNFQAGTTEGEHTWDFGDGNTTDGANPSHIYTQNGTYEVTHTIDNGNCSTVSETQTIILDCPRGNCDVPIGIVIGTYTNDRTKISDLIANNTLPANTVANQSFTINGELEIDLNYEFVDCEFLMNAGASIKTIKQLTITSADPNDSQSKLYGCRYLWKGIEVVEDLIMNHTTISDAQIAIAAHSNSSTHIQNSQFLGNFVAYYVPPTTNNSIRTAVFSSTNTRYTGGKIYLIDPQINHYWDTSVAELADAYCAIWVNDLAGISIGTTTTPNYSNYFNDLNAGVITDNATVGIFTPYFEDINDKGSDYKEVKGTAIYAENNSLVLVNGMGNSAFDPFSFFNVQTGVNAIGSSLTFTNNHLGQVNTGIIGANSSFSDISIDDNYFDCKNTAINISNQFSMSALSITNNQFIDNTSPQGLTTLRLDGIQPSNNALATVSNNRFDIQQTLNVLHLRNSHHIELVDNTINFTAPNLNRKAFLVEGCDQVLFSNNIIRGIQVDLNQSNFFHAFDIINSSNCNYCCNSLQNTNVGMKFSGACNPSPISGTTFNQHYYGLQLTDNTVIGDQEHRGNRWLGEDYNVAAFFDETEAAIIDDSEFIIYEGTTNSAIIPPSIIPANGWFEPVSSNLTYTCRSNDPDCTNIVGFTATDQSIISNSFTLSEAAIQYELEKSLYQKIEQQRGLGENIPTIYQDYYQLKSIESLGQLADIEKAVSNLLIIDQTELRNINSQIQNLLQRLEEVNNEPLYLSLLDLTNEKLQMTTSLVQQNSQMAANLINSNSQINTSQLFELNNKVVNDVFLQLLVNNSWALSNLQKEQLENIARQCWKKGGNAVFKARTLLNLDYENTCGIIEPRTNYANIGQQQKDLKALQIIPNPANGEQVLLRFPLEIKEQTTLQVFNLLGEKVYQSSLNRKIEQYNLFISDWNNGIYIISIKGKSKTIAKLVVNH